MPRKKDDKMKIVTKGNRIITRKELFERKERFHKKQAKLSFEEKIRILIRLQGIAKSIHKSTSAGKPEVWKIPSKSRSK
jgi:hypothetical protein